MCLILVWLLLLLLHHSSGDLCIRGGIFHSVGMCVSLAVLFIHWLLHCLQYLRVN